MNKTAINNDIKGRVFQYDDFISTFKINKLERALENDKTNESTDNGDIYENRESSVRITKPGTDTEQEEILRELAGKRFQKMFKYVGVKNGSRTFEFNFED